MSEELYFVLSISPDLQALQNDSFCDEACKGNIQLLLRSRFFSYQFQMIESDSETLETGPSVSDLYETLEGEDAPPSIQSSTPIDIHNSLVQGALTVIMCFVVFIFSFILRSCTDALNLVRFLNKPSPG